MAPYGHFWSFSSHIKVPFVGTLKLCQEMPDTMQNKSGHFNHTILRKRWKYGQNIDDFIFFLLLTNGQLGWTDSCCISSPILWEAYKVPARHTLRKLWNGHFWPKRPFWGHFSKIFYPLLGISTCVRRCLILWKTNTNSFSNDKSSCPSETYFGSFEI